RGRTQTPHPRNARASVCAALCAPPLRPAAHPRALHAAETADTHHSLLGLLALGGGLCAAAVCRWEQGRGGRAPPLSFYVDDALHAAADGGEGGAADGDDG